MVFRFDQSSNVRKGEDPFHGITTSPAYAWPRPHPLMQTPDSVELGSKVVSFGTMTF